jgi:hypothetical protein
MKIFNELSDVIKDDDFDKWLRKNKFDPTNSGELVNGLIFNNKVWWGVPKNSISHRTFEYVEYLKTVEIDDKINALLQ